MVEFALLAPVVIIMLFLCIDFARLVYTYAAVSWAARQAARVVSMEPQASSDCAAIQTAMSSAQGFLLRPDENSVVGNADPNSSSSPNADPNPPAGVGKIYIWPAVATRSPADLNCNGAATPSVTTSGIQENQILVSSVLQAGPTPTSESIVIKYSDEWALDAYDAYVKINNGSPIYFSDGIWNPRPTSGQTLPPNAVTNIPSDSNPAKPTGLEIGAGNYTKTTTSSGDPKWTMTYPVGGIYGPKNGSTFTVEGNWTWGHERDLLTAVRGNDLATLTYTFPVPAGQTVTVSMFMTDGDRCGDYVTSTWTFNNIGQPAPGVQVVGSVRLEA